MYCLLGLLQWPKMCLRAVKYGDLPSTIPTGYNQQSTLKVAYHT